MIVLINPNATAAMTQAMARVAQDHLPRHTVEGWTSTDGPAAIQGPEDGALAVPPLLSLVQKANERGAQAILIGCFDDTGLSQARAIADCPVIGIGQAGYQVAAAVGRRFSVVTTLAVSVPVLEANITAYGLDPHLARVRASGVPVLQVETAQHAILDEIHAAQREDDIDTVVLGCGGMTTLVDTAQTQTGLRVIDGVRAAASIAAAVA
ncbi:MAG: aspartate/glutamate racemase family protein [Sedimentitalea sp.]|uniref:aspartate/glutamate racemase family protein n=1 Tax=Rhodobacterales TaxID=204455 RepID=UPI003296B6D3